MIVGETMVSTSAPLPARMPPPEAFPEVSAVTVDWARMLTLCPMTVAPGAMYAETVGRTSVLAKETPMATPPTLTPSAWVLAFTVAWAVRPMSPVVLTYAPAPM